MLPHGHETNNALPPIQNQHNPEEWSSEYSVDLPFTIVSWRGLENLPDDIKESLTQQCHEWLLYTPQACKNRINSDYEARILTEYDTQNTILHGEYGVIALKDIPAFTALGAYGGRLLTSVDVAVHDFETYQGPLEKYLYACDSEGYPAISGYKTGNIITLVNDWRPSNFETHPNLEEFQKEHQNCQAIIGKFGDSMWCPFYISIKDIKKGQEILTNYGNGYWG